MKDTLFFRQAQLLLRILPHVAKEECYALKGGTAINYFVREVPRLSVDIDLVYLPIESRDDTLNHINESLNRIAASITRFIPETRIQKRFIKGISGVVKLNIKIFDVQITIEPNLIIRGSLFPCEEKSLTKKAESLFNVSTSMKVMSIPDLYGGKLCAALDRQHSRDLFDVKVLFENEGITEQIRKAFVVYLASSDRPMHELLNPQLKDFKETYAKDFDKMAVNPVSIDLLIEARKKLVQIVQNDLTENEREFLLSVKQGQPQWDLMDVEGIERLPAIQWKVMNARKLSPQKHKEYVTKLKKVLGL